jgi:hypothetical protein
MVVAYRRLTVYYKIMAPTEGAMKDYEEDLLYSGFSIVRAMTNRAKQVKHGVDVLPHNHSGFRNTDLIRIQGTEPFHVS